jgi:hypothetical protein
MIEEISDDGTYVYVPPLQPEKTETTAKTVTTSKPATTSKTGPTDLHFHHILTVALKATTAAEDGHGSAATAMNDWAVVEQFMANQYRLALSISNPTKRKAAVDALTTQYDDYFKGHRASGFYDGVVDTAGQQTESEPANVRTAEIQLYNAQFNPTSPQSTGLATGYIAGELQQLYGNENNGIYTAAQIKAAVGALDMLDPAHPALQRRGARLPGHVDRQGEWADPHRPDVGP